MPVPVAAVTFVKREGSPPAQIVCVPVTEPAVMSLIEMITQLLLAVQVSPFTTEVATRR